MLQRDLKAIANESIFNPNKPTVQQQVLMDVGNKDYYVIKAVEEITLAQKQGSKIVWHERIRHAIELLILARTKENENGQGKTTRQKTTKT